MLIESINANVTKKQKNKTKQNKQKQKTIEKTHTLKNLNCAWAGLNFHSDITHQQVTI